MQYRPGYPTPNISQHPSMRQIRTHIPGTSTLSLPAVHSSFPARFDPRMPSYSLDLVEVRVENYPNSHAYFTSYCNMAIKAVIDGIIRNHGFAENSQVVKDFKARAKGIHPTPVMPTSDDSGLGLSEDDIDKLIEARTVLYQECIQGEAYYGLRAKEVGHELERLRSHKREIVISRTTGISGSVFQPLPIAHSQAAPQQMNVPAHVPTAAELQSTSHLQNKEEVQEEESSSKDKPAVHQIEPISTCQPEGLFIMETRQRQELIAAKDTHAHEGHDEEVNISHPFKTEATEQENTSIEPSDGMEEANKEGGRKSFGDLLKFWTDFTLDTTSPSAKEKEDKQEEGTEDDVFAPAQGVEGNPPPLNLDFAPYIRLSQGYDPTSPVASPEAIGGDPFESSEGSTQRPVGSRKQYDIIDKE